MRITLLRIKDEKSACRIMASVGASQEGLSILAPKAVSLAFKVEGIRSWAANIIKQHLLSLGSDAAIARNALVKDITTSVLLFGSLSQLRKLCGKLRSQPFGLSEAAEQISACLDNFSTDSFEFRARRFALKIKRPLVCGIINVTTDSFSGDGLAANANLVEAALRQAESMVKHGAKILDVGGESTRPGALPVKEAREIKRVAPVIKALRREFKSVLISVDTYKFPVAKAAIEAGADIVNDITALRRAPGIAGLIKKYKLGCVLMHMQGTPKTMQVDPGYDDVVSEVTDFFKRRLEFTREQGIADNQIILDPGIGFGKRLEDNLALINGLCRFKIFGRPLLVGLSRKSFIGKLLNAQVGQRLIGTAAANAAAVMRGADILRVHDVKEAVQVIKIAGQIAGR